LGYADNRILIICDRRQSPYAIAIRDHFREEFFDPEIRVVHRMLPKVECLGKCRYNWLVIWELIEEPEKGITFQSGLFNGINFAHKWLANHSDGRAIVITRSPWKQITDKSKFIDRLSPVPDDILTQSNIYFLTEIVHAGQADYTLIPPTVVEFRLSQEEGNCVLELDSNAKGPLQDMLTNSLRGPFSDRPRQILGNFDDAVDAFQEACDNWDHGHRREGLMRVANMLYPKSGRRRCHLLTLLLETVKEVLSLWRESSEEEPSEEEPPKPMNPNVPFPIHLHLLCEPEMLSVPIDLIMDKFISKGHICAMMPVIWRIKTRGSRHHGSGEIGQWNHTNYGNFSVIYSCCEESKWEECVIDPIGDVHEKAERILELADSGDSQPIRIATMDELHRAIIRNVEHGSFHVVHVISHGSRSNPADLTYIFVGPDHNGDATPVTANQLGSDIHSGERSPDFAFFNCCELGYQDAKRAALSSYYGGFAEGVISTGLCHEIIANRWGANQYWAHRLELAFYETKPCTAQTRAVALLRARLKVLKEMTPKPAEGQFEPTWLAPIHIWAESYSP
jgi:hypothetical protein